MAADTCVSDSGQKIETGAKTTPELLILWERPCAWISESLLMQVSEIE
jgi:hypothetical protein